MKQITGLQCVCGAADGEGAGAAQYLHERPCLAGVFGKFLAGGEIHQGEPQGGGGEHGLTHNAMGYVLS